MGQDRIPAKRAIVRFARAGEAGRRVAGVAAAARIVRELAEAGLAEAWLALPAGDALDAGAAADVRRLAGPLEVRVASGDLPAAIEGREDVRRLAGNRLVAAQALRGGGGGEALALDRRGASAAIMRATGKAGDGPVSRRLNRPVSRLMSRLLLHVPGIRPLHATFGTALLALSMFASLAFGGEAGLLAGGLLFHAASVFDGVDGEIARATFRSSHAGAVLDSAVDVGTNLLFIIGVTLNLGERSDLAFLLAGWGFALFVVGLAAIAWRASRAAGPFSLDMVKHFYRRRFSGRLLPWLIEALTIVSSRDFFALLFAMLILAGLPMAVLYLFAAAATVWILFVLASMRLPLNAPLAPERA